MNQGKADIKINKMNIEIKTKRLVIKKPQIRDKQKLISELNNKEVSKWLENVTFPYSEKDADKWINSLTINNLEFNIFLENNLIGGIGLKEDYRLGYWLGEDYWGNGYATEAVSELIEYAFKIIKIKKITARYMTENTISAKVLKKLGFTEIGKDLIFSIARNEKVSHTKVELIKT